MKLAVLNLSSSTVLVTKKIFSKEFKELKDGFVKTSVWVEPKILKEKKVLFKKENKQMKQSFAKLLMKSVDFNWEDNIGELPDIKEVFLGETHNGKIKISPKEYYAFAWSILGKVESGWKAIIKDWWIKDGFYQFKVKLFKDKYDPVERVFQIGPNRKLIKGDKRLGEDSFLSVFAFEEIKTINAIEHIGKFLQLMISADRKSYANHFLSLKGELLGITNANGVIDIPLKKYYRYQWRIVKKGNSGWHVYMDDWWIKDGSYYVKVKVSKKGITEKHIFQIGPNKKFIKGYGKAKEKKHLTVFELNEVGRFDASRHFARFLLLPESVDWSVYWDQFSDLKNQLLGITHADGKIKIYLKENYFYDWYVLGTKGSGWSVVFEDWWVKDGFFQFRIKMTKRGHKFKERIFQVDRHRKAIKGVESAKNKDPIYIFDVKPIKPIDYISRLMQFSEGDNGDKLDRKIGLKNELLGVTGTQGKIFIQLARNYQLSWRVLGKKEAGWTVVVKDEWIEAGFYQFKVEISKQGHSFERTFQIGPYWRYVKGRRQAKNLPPMKVLAIIDIDIIRGYFEREKQKSVWQYSDGDMRVREVVSPYVSAFDETLNREFHERLRDILGLFDESEYEISEMLLFEEKSINDILEEKRFTVDQIIQVQRKLQKGMLEFYDSGKDFDVERGFPKMKVMAGGSNRFLSEEGKDRKSSSVLQVIGEASSLKKGGIDLTHDGLNLQTTGQGLKFDLPFEELENMDIQGFIPVIFQIVPVTNLPLFLGIHQEPLEDTQDEVGRELGLLDIYREPYYYRKNEEHIDHGICRS